MLVLSCLPLQRHKLPSDSALPEIRNKAKCSPTICTRCWNFVLFLSGNWPTKSSFPSFGPDLRGSNADQRLWSLVISCGAITTEGTVHPSKCRCRRNQNCPLWAGFRKIHAVPIAGPISSSIAVKLVERRGQNGGDPGGNRTPMPYRD